MNVRNFWTILLKLLGIWLILELFATLTQTFSSIATLLSSNLSAGTMVYLSAVVLLALAMSVLIIFVFMFKTSWLIDLLKLDKGFPDENLNVNVNSVAVIQIAIIVTGGLMLIDSLPKLSQQTYSFIQLKTMAQDPAPGWILFYLIKGAIGYWLMTNSKKVLSFIEKHREE